MHTQGIRCPSLVLERPPTIMRGFMMRAGDLRVPLSHVRYMPSHCMNALSMDTRAACRYQFVQDLARELGGALKHWGTSVPAASTCACKTLACQDQYT
jgi:hypothetical protein